MHCTTSFSLAYKRGTLEDVDSVRETLQVAVCVLISIAAVVPLVIVWRDDHSWLDRARR